MKLVKQVTKDFKLIKMAASKPKIKTFIFMDCETTGLPGYETNVKITELSLVAVLGEHLKTKSTKPYLPRIFNKLTLCFNPQKCISLGATQITGLSNELLEHYLPFSSTTVDIINGFISMLPQPACFVAHNGNRFDYPLLQKQTRKVQKQLFDDLLCIDSMLLFKHAHKLEIDRLKAKDLAETQKTKIPVELMDDDWDDLISQKLDELDSDPEFIARMTSLQKAYETTPKKPAKVCINDSSIDSLYCHPETFRRKLSFGNQQPKFNLTDVYERLTGLKANNVHEAECDVLMIIQCAAVMGEEFLTIANETVIPFKDIQAMKN